MKNAKIKFIVAMLTFGSIGLFVRNIDISSSQIALTRGMIGSLFLFVSSALKGQKMSWKRIKTNYVLLICSGAAMGFNWIFLFEAYKYTSIANATLSYYFAPVFVLLLAPIVLKEKLTRKNIMCIIGAMMGMLFILGNREEFMGLTNMQGIGYGFLAAGLYTSVILMNKLLKGLSGLETTLMQLGIASIVLLPYVLVTEGVGQIHMNQKSFLLLVTLGILHTGIAYFLYFTSMQKLSGQTIAVFSYIDPISAIIMSSVLLGEQMSAIQIIGGAFILGATLFNEMGK